LFHDCFFLRQRVMFSLDNEQLSLPKHSINLNQIKSNQFIYQPAQVTTKKLCYRKDDRAMRAI